MPLDSNGRVVLKIYDKDGNLLIARPCVNDEEADNWFATYSKDRIGLTYTRSNMVPRI